jgi:hypothetical protein
MKILVACEESQAVTKEFRKLGHEAYSCDIQECSGGHPEWHLQQDVTELLEQDWDMIIAFPPCTYTSNAGAAHLWKGHELNKERYKTGLEYKSLFMKIYNCKCSKIAIENPTPSKIFNYPIPTQVIQPYEHGHELSKRTLLWLKGLPLLEPTKIVKPMQSCHDAHTWYSKGGKDRQRNRSKTFPGIAKAMATQWGDPTWKPKQIDMFELLEN